MRKQLDLELDATGIEEQLSDLSAKAVELGCRWIQSIDPETMRPTMQINDPKLLDLLRQAAAVQHLIDKMKGG